MRGMQSRKTPTEKRMNTYEGLIENKRTRLQMKCYAKAENKSKEIREGITTDVWCCKYSCQ